MHFCVAILTVLPCTAFSATLLSACSHTRDVGCRCRTVNYQIYKFIDIRLYLWRLAPYFSGVFSSELSPKSIFCIVTVGELLIAYFLRKSVFFTETIFFLVIFVYSIPFTHSRFFFFSTQISLIGPTDPGCCWVTLPELYRKSLQKLCVFVSQTPFGRIAE